MRNSTTNSNARSFSSSNTTRFVGRDKRESGIKLSKLQRLGLYLRQDLPAVVEPVAHMCAWATQRPAVEAVVSIQGNGGSSSQVVRHSRLQAR